MSRKLVLFVLVVVPMLAAAMAIPAVADDGDIPMWVTRVRLAHNGRSSSSPDRVVAMVHVRDANRAAVTGAQVAAEWTLPNGAVTQVTAETAFQGIATFEVWAGSGTYRLCVTDVTKDGWQYDPDLNGETCGTLVITWPYSPPE